MALGIDNAVGRNGAAGEKRSAAPEVARRVAGLRTSLHSRPRVQECSWAPDGMAHGLLQECADRLAEKVWSRSLALRFPESAHHTHPHHRLQTPRRTAARKAGLRDRRIYDLRASFASRANSCNASGLTVAHLLGHASTQILPTYVKALDDNTKAVIGALEAARNSHQLLWKSIQ